MRVGRPACLPYHARNVAEISLASVNLPSELRKVSARGLMHEDGSMGHYKSSVPFLE